jgi:hypothetical protein
MRLTGIIAIGVAMFMNGVLTQVPTSDKPAHLLDFDGNVVHLHDGDKQSLQR